MQAIRSFVVNQQVQRCTDAAQVIFHAAQDERAAVAIAARADFLRAHPDFAHDAFIQAAAGMVRAERAAEGSGFLRPVSARTRVAPLED